MMKMSGVLNKILNEVLIDWGNQTEEDNGLISQKDINARLSRLSYEDWRLTYLTDEIPEEWTFKHGDFPEVFKRRFRQEANIGIFYILYNLLEPYTKEFIDISIKMIDKMFIDEGTSWDNPMAQWYGGTLSFAVTNLLFGRSPKAFVKDTEKWMSSLWRNNYLTILTDKERNILEKIHTSNDEGRIDTYRGQSYYDRFIEEKESFNVLDDIMPFIKKFGKYNIERIFF